jgi:hypothetical protein
MDSCINWHNVTRLYHTFSLLSRIVIQKNEGNQDADQSRDYLAWMACKYLNIKPAEPSPSSCVQ